MILKLLPNHCNIYYSYCTLVHVTVLSTFSIGVLSTKHFQIVKEQQMISTEIQHSKSNSHQIQ